MKLRIGIFTVSQQAVGISFSEDFSVCEGSNTKLFEIDISSLLPGKYCFELILTQMDCRQKQVKHDALKHGVVMFEVRAAKSKKNFGDVNASWGFFELPETICD